MNKRHPTHAQPTVSGLRLWRCLLERAYDICDRISDGAPDDSPLALEALQLAGDIKAALGAAP